MRRLLIIGVGSGDPEHMTVQAIRALNTADVIFVVDKGDEKKDLLDLRTEICRRYLEGDAPRIVTVPDPERDRSAVAYRSAVADWRSRRADAYERLVRDELGDDASGAFLVWGDPSFYDSTLAVLEEVASRGTVTFEIEVIPGISSIQALAARHAVSLTSVGRPVLITTGRRLAEGFPEGVDDVVVMLDGDCAFTKIDGSGIEIHWGAYVGSEDELLIAGDLSVVAEEIVRARAEARARKGWIMDSYLLRRRPR